MRAVYLLDLFEKLVDRESPIKGIIIRKIFQEFRKAEEKNIDKPFPFQNFYPFLWVALFAQVQCPANKISRTPLAIRISIDEKEISKDLAGIYTCADNVVRVRPTLENKAINYKLTAATLAHEIGHAVTNFVYDNSNVPPLKTWSNFLAIRSSLFAKLADNSHEAKNFFSGLCCYQMNKFPNELIARTLEYSILHGQIPGGYTDAKLENATKEFLKDCENFLGNISSSYLTIIFPWLKSFNPKSGYIFCPEEELDFFHLVITEKSLWDAALKSQNINFFKRIMVLDPQLASFPMDKFTLLPADLFKSQILHLITTVAKTRAQQQTFLMAGSLILMLRSTGPVSRSQSGFNPKDPKMSI